MSKGNTFENDLLLLVLNNTNISLIGDATGLRGSSTAGNLYIALHSSAPAEGDSQNTNEISYTGYARVAVVRSSSGWTVVGNAASNAAIISFGPCTAGSATVAGFSVGTDSSGAGKILYKGTCTLSISVGITPQFAIGELDITED